MCSFARDYVTLHFYPVCLSSFYVLSLLVIIVLFFYFIHFNIYLMCLLSYSYIDMEILLTTNLPLILSIVKVPTISIDSSFLAEYLKILKLQIAFAA